MKTFVGLTVFGAFALSVALSFVSLSPSEAEAKSCYSLYAKAEKAGSRYRHIVYVENDCDYWLRCSVWTDDASPQTPKIFSVGPGMTEHVETSGDSSNADPKAFGTCRDE